MRFVPELQRAVLLGALASATAMSAGCRGVDDPRALSEPLVVHQADFKPGALPRVDPEGPSITTLEVGTLTLLPGLPHVPIAGRTTEGAFSVGVRLLDQGSGYWVVPVGAEDLLTPGERLWELAFDVGHGVAPGRKTLGLVAFDEAGRAGPQASIGVCIRSELPDEGNVCDPTIEPPAAIASLRWNADADLDLIVIAPDGTRYGRNKFSQVVDGKVVARLDADRTSGCLLDGRRIESFAWKEQPPKGTWYVYANLFDACAEPSVRFELTLYRKQSHAGGSFSLREEKVVGGQLLRAQSRADAERPLYLTKIEFP